MSAAVPGANGTCPCRRCQAAVARLVFRTHEAWLAHHRLQHRPAGTLGEQVRHLVKPA